MIEPLARLGYASKALVYAVSGGLAAAAALEKGGAITCGFRHATRRARVRRYRLAISDGGGLGAATPRRLRAAWTGDDMWSSRIVEVGKEATRVADRCRRMSRAVAGRAWSGRSGSLRLAVYAALAGLLSHPGGSASAQSAANFLPVGVRYRADNAADVSRRDLEEMQRLRFNVIEFAARPGERDKRSLVFIDRLLAGAPDPRVMLELDTPPATITVGAGRRGAEVTTAAWSALARGDRGVIFADWAALLDNPDALAAAAEFAEAVARNAALYAPLRPVSTTNGDERRVRISSDRSAVEATLLESPEALVLIAVNRSAREQRSTMAFSPDVPEAIWQNMLAGSAVNFVAGSEGPMYERTFAPDEVVVLVIRKDRR